MTAPAPSDLDDFRAVMGRFATGVSVMTVSVDDRPHGMTANAVASVALDPLLVLVCVDKSTVMSWLVRRSNAFALSILAADQRHLSDHFADPDRPQGEDQFAGVGTHLAVTGSPLLDGAIAWLDCRTWRTYDGGDHDIVVGEVVHTAVGDDADALGYFRSTYLPIPTPNPPT